MARIELASRTVHFGFIAPSTPFHPHIDEGHFLPLGPVHGSVAGGLAEARTPNLLLERQMCYASSTTKSYRKFFYLLLAKRRAYFQEPLAHYRSWSRFLATLRGIEPLSSERQSDIIAFIP